MSDLRAIGLSDLKAAPGKFRAVVLIDSETYQIAEDVSSLSEAIMLFDGEKSGASVQVYDENGRPQINKQ